MRLLTAAGIVFFFAIGARAAAEESLLPADHIHPVSMTLSKTARQAVYETRIRHKIRFRDGQRLLVVSGRFHDPIDRDHRKALITGRFVDQEENTIITTYDTVELGSKNLTYEEKTFVLLIEDDPAIAVCRLHVRWIE